MINDSPWLVLLLTAFKNHLTWFFSKTVRKKYDLRLPLRIKKGFPSLPPPPRKKRKDTFNHKPHSVNNAVNGSLVNWLSATFGSKRKTWNRKFNWSFNGKLRWFGPNISQVKTWFIIQLKHVETTSTSTSHHNPFRRRDVYKIGNSTNHINHQWTQWIQFITNLIPQHLEVTTATFWRDQQS